MNLKKDNANKVLLLGLQYFNPNERFDKIYDIDITLCILINEQIPKVKK